MNRWKLPVRRGRRAAGGVDQYGETVPGEMSWEPLPPAMVEPERSEEERTPGVNAVSYSPTIYWRDSKPDIREGDLLDIDGRIVEVSGEPEGWPKGLVVRTTSRRRGEVT